MSTTASQPLVGRLAPSPTGRLHLGHARSFLLAWWSIRSRGGQMRLRIEDLDGARARPEFVSLAQRDLEWLGMDWDGEALLQSSGVERLQAALGYLSDAGLAYPCVCTRADLRSAVSAPHAGDTEIPYPGTCRGRFDRLDGAEASAGREAGLRFTVAAGRVKVSDALCGDVEFDVAEESGDFLIARRDKTPAYQLAVVVDDAYQQVSEVLRGDDLLPSAARQQLLQVALGLSTPRWIHVPLVLDESGRRLAKRADDLSLEVLREGGTDPRAIVGWAANSAGFDVPERAHAAEVTPIFGLSEVRKEPVRLTRRTLEALKDARA